MFWFRTIRVVFSWFIDYRSSKIYHTHCRDCYRLVIWVFSQRFVSSGYGRYSNITPSKYNARVKILPLNRVKSVRLEYNMRLESYPEGNSLCHPTYLSLKLPKYFRIMNNAAKIYGSHILKILIIHITLV